MNFTDCVSVNRLIYIFMLGLTLMACGNKVEPTKSGVDSDSVAQPVVRIDSVYINRLTPEQLDSLEFRLTHHYTVNDNFIVKADSIRLVPREGEMNDTSFVHKDEMLVVVKIKRNRVAPNDSIELSQADASLKKSLDEATLEADHIPLPEDEQTPENRTDSVTADTVWIKVAGSQFTMGWITESTLLKHTVPNDNISQLIDSLTATRLLWMGALLLMGVLGLYLHRAYNKKQLNVVKINEMDSFYPFLFIMLVALMACLYASIQNFTPEFWQEYYFHPTLNPFLLPLPMALLVIIVWLLLVVFIALVMEVYNNFRVKRGAVYLLEIIGASMFIYLIISWTTQIYIGYLLFIVFVWFLWVLYNGYVKCPYQCPQCGAKLKEKGRCSNCGAIIE